MCLSTNVAPKDTAAQVGARPVCDPSIQSELQDTFLFNVVITFMLCSPSNYKDKCEVECAIIKLSKSNYINKIFISSIVDIPVEIINGLPVDFFFLSKLISVNDAEPAL